MAKRKAFFTTAEIEVAVALVATLDPDRDRNFGEITIGCGQGWTEPDAGPPVCGEA